MKGYIVNVKLFTFRYLHKNHNMIVEKCNNNIEDNLVTEFLNIWSDLKKFNSTERDSLSEKETSPPIINVERVDRMIDPRDVQENLFAEYNGTYKVKRGKKVISSKTEVIPARKTRLGRRKRYRKVEKQDKASFPESSGAMNKLNANVPTLPTPTATKGDSSCESQKNPEEILFCGEDTPEMHRTDDQEVAQHTQILLSFLKSVNILPVLEEEDESALLSRDDVVEKEIEVSPRSLTTPLLDDNNNRYDSSVIIDIITDSSDTHSEDDIIEGEEVKVSGETRWLDVIEEDIMKASLVMQDYKHPLEHEWTFWYFFHQEDKTWSQSLEALVTVSTIEDFWSVINWVESPSSIKVGSDFSMFKRGIVPDWSDKSNQKGGRYIVRCRKEEVDTMWTELMMALIGQNFVDPENDCKINGGVVSIRKREDKIAIWVRNVSDGLLAQDSVMAVLGRMGEFCIHKH